MGNVDPREHTTAALERQFDALSDAEKLKAIWFNGRETNGAVARVIERVDRLEPLVDEMVDRGKDTNAVAHFVKLWGGRGTGLIVLVIVIATFVMMVARG